MSKRTMRYYFALRNTSPFALTINSVSYDTNSYVGGPGLDPAQMEQSTIAAGGHQIWALEIYRYVDYYECNPKIGVNGTNSLGTDFAFEVDPVHEAASTHAVIVQQVGGTSPEGTSEPVISVTAVKLSDETAESTYKITYGTHNRTGTLEYTVSEWLPPLDEWMSHLGDETSLADLTIPGTHDSGTSTSPLGVQYLVKTQSMSIEEQLDSGIRAFDIRVCVTWTTDPGGDKIEELRIHHDKVPMRLLYSDVITAFQEFLAKHPRECIIMLCNQEYSRDPAFAKKIDLENQRLNQHFVEWLDPGPRYPLRTPTLKNLRGSIVLLRRYPGSGGVDMTGWPDDNKQQFEGYVRNSEFYVQDYYALGQQNPPPPNADPTDITKWFDQIAYLKLEKMKQAFAKLDVPPHPWVINFSSLAAAIGNRDSISGYSDPMNQQLVDYLVKQHLTRYGTIFMDFPTVAQLTLLISTNFGTRAR